MARTWHAAYQRKAIERKTIASDLAKRFGRDLQANGELVTECAASSFDQTPMRRANTCGDCASPTWLFWTRFYRGLRNILFTPYLNEVVTSQRRLLALPCPTPRASFAAPTSRTRIPTLVPVTESGLHSRPSIADATANWLRNKSPTYGDVEQHCWHQKRPQAEVAD